jgi:hypothetical protein
MRLDWLKVDNKLVPERKQELARFVNELPLGHQPVI